MGRLTIKRKRKDKIVRRRENRIGKDNINIIRKRLDELRNDKRVE